MVSINVAVPDNIQDKISVSNIYENIGANGRALSYGIDLRLDVLDLRKSLRSRELGTLRAKVEDTLTQWGKRYERHTEQQYKLKRDDEAKHLNDELTSSLENLSRILEDTLGVDDSINWGRLKSYQKFSIKPQDLFGGDLNKRPSFISFANNGKPKDFTKLRHPTEPTRVDAKKQVGLLFRLFAPKKVDETLNAMKRDWEAKVKETDDNNAARARTFEEARQEYERLKTEFEEAQLQQNKAIDDLHKRYLDGEPDAVEEHTDIVFQNSQYPDEVPRNWEIEYRPDSRMLIVNLELPTPDDLPSAESYRYVKSRDAIETKEMSATKKRQLYDDVVFKMVLRTIHEVFEADVAGTIEAVALNGYIDAINPATGKQEVKTIASISATREAFDEINLASIDPKATFKHFKGVSAAKLSDLAPVPPVIQMNKTDKRFIEGRDVAQSLNEGSNIASMSWQDFEYLIREIFHREFSASGGEVKVTQASADGGVDAIAFDNDPLRGGKIVIQAKRYTNTVGISAVRDLYGTLLNEGASSGILVTTSDYGKDAYEFAKDKPLKLLNGSNLLSLLERHGHKARIDLAEAKRLAKQ